MDVVSFDEVQEMLIADMEKVLERLSGSDLKFVLMGSTANWPDADIHFWYQRGTRHRFYTRCPACGRRDFTRAGPRSPEGTRRHRRPRSPAPCAARGR